MRIKKYLWPMAFVTALAGCSFSGGNAPITDGPTSATIYTVKQGDTLYSIASRYGLNPTDVARENNLANPSQIFVGQKLSLSVSSGTAANIQRVAANSNKPSAASSSPTSTTPKAETKTADTPAKSAESAKSTAETNVKTTGAYSWPASGKILESFGGMNKGIDIAGSEGEAVKAATDGVVLFVGNVQGYGNVAMVRDKAGYVSVYGRVKSVAVKQGQTVKKGQKIATMGTTDKSPRVHFEVRINGKPVNPLTMLQKR